jgi:DNA-binding transcriptional regulator/RsmH inhibitor MraZ
VNQATPIQLDSKGRRSLPATYISKEDHIITTYIYTTPTLKCTYFPWP